MITTTDKFNRLLTFTDKESIEKMRSERAERVDLLDKFAGCEDFDEQIKMLEDEIAQLDAAIDAAMQTKGE